MGDTSEVTFENGIKMIRAGFSQALQGKKDLKELEAKVVHLQSTNGKLLSENHQLKLDYQNLKETSETKLKYYKGLVDIYQGSVSINEELSEKAKEAIKALQDFEAMAASASQKNANLVEIPKPSPDIQAGGQPSTGDGGGLTTNKCG